MLSTPQSGLITFIRQEGALLAGAGSAVLFFLFGDAWLADLTDPLATGLLFVWIFAVMLWCSFAVVRHADCLAELLGEPYGTLILTIAVITIEVSLIAAIMITGGGNPTLARDTMMAVIMIVLNGMIGVSLLLGGLRHVEQSFNFQGAGAFLAVLVPLATMSLILPTFTTSTEEPTLTPLQGVLFATMTIVLYGIFLAIQTLRHRTYFVQPASVKEDLGEAAVSYAHHHPPPRSMSYHAVFLVLTMVPIVFLSKKLAVLIDFGIEVLGAPPSLGGVLVAILVLTPEGIAAFQAAMADRLQRAVNICLGSALATIGLTVPAALVIGLVVDLKVILGLDPVKMVLLVLTLLVSMLTFGGVRTNMLQGAVHLVIFFVYIILIFNP
ncbi:MAG: calcium:proton antiporter [Pseudomonadota bacterium]